MLHIKFELPDKFNLALLQSVMQKENIMIDEVPGTNPPIVTAMSNDPELFYRLGALVAVQIMNDELKKKGFETDLPYIEIYGHWTNDETKPETELLMCLK
jgi:hypothetical protein